MQLSVPFFPSEEENDCGPMALKMVLAFFGKSSDAAMLKKMMRPTHTGMVWGWGIALTAKMCGCEVKAFYVPEKDEKDQFSYYKTNVHEDEQSIPEQLLASLKKEKAEPEKKALSLDKLTSFVSEDTLPIVLLNWNVIKGEEGFFGHFAPVVGYDDEHIIIHQPSTPAESFMKIKKDLFEEAWNALGTERECIVIEKNA